MGEIEDSEARTNPPLFNEVDRRQVVIDEATEAIRELRLRTERITTEELLSARSEGHRL
jgi:hypothetical protein